MSQTTADSLGLELVVPSRVRTGESVPLSLRVRNLTARPLDLYLRGRAATFDVVIMDSAGTVLWRRLEGEIIPAIVHLRTLRPGEQLQLDATWDQRSNDGTPVEAGSYTARGFLMVEGDPLATPPAALRVER